MFKKASNLQCDTNKKSVLTKVYTRPLGRSEHGGEENLFRHRRFNPSLSPCLLKDLSQCTLKTWADNIQSQIQTNAYVP
jgi:hypothetical protein